jgi:hypothetical protein
MASSIIADPTYDPNRVVKIVALTLGRRDDYLPPLIDSRIFTPYGSSYGPDARIRLAYVPVSLVELIQRRSAAGPETITLMPCLLLLSPIPGFFGADEFSDRHPVYFKLSHSAFSICGWNEFRGRQCRVRDLTALA